MGAQLPLVVLASVTNKCPILVEGVLTGERREEAKRRVVVEEQVPAEMRQQEAVKQLGRLCLKL